MKMRQTAKAVTPALSFARDREIAKAGGISARTRRSRILLATSATALALVFGIWILFGSWPSPVPGDIPWRPDAIVVPGGGDKDRVQETLRVAALFPEAPVIISGDQGFMEKAIRESALPPTRLLIEPDAESTWENAKFSAPFISGRGFKRVALVTNWFHVPRAEAVFRKQFPGVEFFTTWKPAPEPVTPWDRNSHRREKLAAIYYLLRYGVNSF